MYDLQTWWDRECYTTITLEKDAATTVFLKVLALVWDNYVEQYVDAKVTS